MGSVKHLALHELSGENAKKMPQTAQMSTSRARQSGRVFHTLTFLAFALPKEQGKPTRENIFICRQIRGLLEEEGEQHSTKQGDSLHKAGNQPRKQGVKAHCQAIASVPGKRPQRLLWMAQRSESPGSLKFGVQAARRLGVEGTTSLAMVL